MLKKFSELEIDPQNPFLNDKLNRLENTETLIKIIKTVTQQFVININSPWGTG